MNATIETLGATSVIGITTGVSMDQVGPKIGELLPDLMAAVGDAAAGPVIARWHCVDGQSAEAEMELAVPVSRAVESASGYTAAELPAGRAVIYWHVGPYEGLAATW